ncbi:hypothetical protein MHYP_G00328010 [Metynnis hypsauchen]
MEQKGSKKTFEKEREDRERASAKLAAKSLIFHEETCCHHPRTGTSGLFPACQLVQEFSEEIWMLVHTVCPAWYKLVCVVALGQKTGHEGVMLASRCLWDVHSDTCVSYTYQSLKLYCTGGLFAVYSE